MSIKNITILFILSFCFTSLKSQDLIILKNNSDTIRCKIIEDKIIFLTYRLTKLSDTIVYKINTSDYDHYTLNTSTVFTNKKTENNFNVDVIYLKNNPDSILCKIIEDKVVVLKYNSLNPLDSITYLIWKKDYEYYTISSTPEIKLKEKEIFPITVEKLKKGAYKSFREFANNEPSIDFNFSVKKRSKFNVTMNGGNDYKVILRNYNISKKQIRKEFWGICDGEYCYINCHKLKMRRFYSILTVTEDIAYFYAPFSPGKGVVMTRVAFTAIGGALGGAIAGAMTSDSRSGKRILHKIHLKNGLIKYYNED